ncbi:hypothetical protein JCM8547_008184 [Rhodosporidiobolus lusitaniae]
MASLSLADPQTGPFAPVADSLSAPIPASRVLTPSPPPSPPHSNSEDEDDEDDTFGPTDKGAGHPFFFPPLWLQRRNFITGELRKEGVQSVVDLGCGQGSLLSLLALPAYHTDDFPLPSTYYLSQLLSPLSTSYSCAPPTRELHLKRLIGVDLSSAACAAAAKACVPVQRAPSSWDGGGEEVGNETRWEALSVEVFEGDVESWNERLEGVEAVVLTEVIEHLTPEALARLPSLLFSVYKPRLILITTPNHSFNAFFAPPPHSPSTSPYSRTSTGRPSPSTVAEESSSHLHPDPSHCTARFFRDPTHLFEFTQPEFFHYAEGLHESLADDERYDLSFNGVGSLEEYYAFVGREVPFPPPGLHLHPALKDEPEAKEPVPDPSAFFATQIAVFIGKGQEVECVPLTFGSA